MAKEWVILVSFLCGVLCRLLNPAGVTIYLDYCLLDGNRSMNSPFSLDSALGAALAVPYAGLSIAYTAQVASKSYSISSHLTLLCHSITLQPLAAFTTGNEVDI